MLLQNRAVVVGMEEGFKNDRVGLRGGDQNRQKNGFIISPTIPHTSVATQLVPVGASLNSSFSSFFAACESEILAA